MNYYHQNHDKMKKYHREYMKNKRLKQRELLLKEKRNIIQ